MYPGCGQVRPGSLELPSPGSVPRGLLDEGSPNGLQDPGAGAHDRDEADLEEVREASHANEATAAGDARAVYHQEWRGTG